MTWDVIVGHRVRVSGEERESRRRHTRIRMQIRVSGGGDEFLKVTVDA